MTGNKYRQSTSSGSATRTSSAALDVRFAPLYRLLPQWDELHQHMLANLRQHGDYPRWQAAIDHLPEPGNAQLTIGDVISLDGNLAADDRARLLASLEALHPWRKGPFNWFGTTVQAEWRSHWKWRRLASAVDLRGCRVLDVGCGNGYFGWRMLATGTELVVGIDSSILCHMQHQAFNHFARSGRNWVLPLRFEQLPPHLTAAHFDAVFSMGVLHHQRDPQKHLEQLRRCLTAGGQAVVESLVVDGAKPLKPPGRYARMRNVWIIPTPATLTAWLAAAGFQDIAVVDVSTTTKQEQRSTPWMRFESLSAALDPNNPHLTIEGHPAPRRCVVTARNLS